jgi:hypothetical protein
VIATYISAIYFCKFVTAIANTIRTDPMSSPFTTRHFSSAYTRWQQVSPHVREEAPMAVDTSITHVCNVTIQTKLIKVYMAPHLAINSSSADINADGVKNFEG